MTLEDLASCEAEVIQPIKYDFKVGDAGDKGVSLWEVSYLAPASDNQADM
jgi:gamma-glutamyltranspeptidase/glutathione hydrolase